MKYIELMSERVLGERLKADETTTTIALTHAIPFQFGREEYTDEEMGTWTKTIIRTGAIYILEDEYMMPDWDMIRDMPLELPPLPFPRLVIEGTKDGEPVVMAWKTEKPPHDELIDLSLIVVLEVEAGIKWNVCFVLEGKNGYHPWLFQVDNRNGELVMLFPNRLTDLIREANETDVKEITRTFAKYTIQCIHVITAKNVAKDKLDLPRGQRRNFSRKYHIEPPAVYRVKLGQAGDQEGYGGWHYKVRFLVCGHWRHYDNGTRTWIKPYIKGPVGAPWKGRPVHEGE